MPDCCPEEGLLDNHWFYAELRAIPLSTQLDLTCWAGAYGEPRWRDKPEHYWIEAPRRREWLSLLNKLPLCFRAEIEFLYTFVLEAARHIVPNLDTILAGHAYVEWILYHDLDYEKYREHIVHPVKVAVVARWLLEQSGKIHQVNKNLDRSEHVKHCLSRLHLSHDFFVRDEYAEDAEKVIWAAMWVAGLFHDLGYGHNFFCTLERRVSESYAFYAGDVGGSSVAGMNRDRIEQSLLARYLLSNSDCKKLREHGSPLVTEFHSPREGWKTKLAESFTCNHSAAGALNLLCVLEEVIDYWPQIDPKLALVFELAAEAVFVHDIVNEQNYLEPQWKDAMNGAQGKVTGGEQDNQASVGEQPDQTRFIDFKTCPLGVILILADEIQEWGRPRLQYSQGDHPYEVKIDYRPTIEGIGFKWERANDESEVPDLTLSAIPRTAGKRLEIKTSTDRFSCEEFVRIKCGPGLCDEESNLT